MTENESIKLRELYLSGQIDRDKYYNTIAEELHIPEEIVYSVASLQSILDSKDQNFNDIPLYLWDNMHITIWFMVAKYIPWSLSDSVCVLKSMARRIKGRYLKEVNNENH